MIRAKDVIIARAFIASCQIPGCDWTGEPLASYEAANSQRQAHLDYHREQENGGQP